MALLIPDLGASTVGGIDLIIVLVVLGRIPAPKP